MNSAILIFLVDFHGIEPGSNRQKYERKKKKRKPLQDEEAYLRQMCKILAVLLQIALLE